MLYKTSLNHLKFIRKKFLKSKGEKIYWFSSLNIITSLHKKNLYLEAESSEFKN